MANKQSTLNWDNINSYATKNTKQSNLNWNDVKGYADYGDSYTELKKKKRRAQIKAEVEAEEKANQWFSLGAFEDGYDVGDISKSILGTATKTGQNFTRGLQSNLEGGLDLGANLLSMGTEYFGMDEATEKLRNFAQEDFLEEHDLANKAMIATNPILGLANRGIQTYENLKDGYDLGDLLLGNNQIADLTGDKSKVSEEMDKIAENTLTGNKLDSLTQTVGQITGQAALGQAGIPWQITAFANSASGEMNNAFQNNATAGQAFLSGLISGMVEVGTEYLGGGADTLLGMESLGSKGLAKLGSKISNKAVQYLTKMGIGAASEGLEEVLSGLGTALGQKLTYMNEADWDDLYSKDQAIEDFVMGALGTIVTNIPNTARSVRRGENAFSGLTENEQKVLDKEIERRTNEAQKGGKELTKKQLEKIQELAQKDLQKGYINTKTIESVLGNDADISKDMYLQESYRELARSSQRANIDTSKIKNQYERETLESANKYLNNSNEARETAQIIAKLAKDTNHTIEFTNNNSQEIQNEMAKIKNNAAEALAKKKGISLDAAKTEIENRFKNTTLNGMKITDKDGNSKILINADSPNILAAVTGHELTHLLENTNEYKNLRKLAMEYAKMQGDKRTADFEDYGLYEGLENGDSDYINQELTADLVGDYVVNNEGFIRELYTKEPTLFQKIKDFIDDLVVRFTGTAEEQKLRECQKSFEKAVRELNQGNVSQTEGSRESLVNIEKVEKFTDSQRKRVREAYRLFKEGYNTDYIWRETGIRYGEDKAIAYTGDLSFKKGINVNNLNKGIYKVGDILDGEIMENYPSLKDVPLEITNFKEDVIKTGTKNQEYIEMIGSVAGGADGDNSIALNSLYLDKHKNDSNINSELENILSHEIQHLIQTKENGELKETIFFFLDENDNIVYAYGDKKLSAQKYRNNPQEIESEVTRVQNRMTPEEIRKFPLDLVFNEVKNHYEKTTKEINPEEFIKQLNNKYGNYSDYWYNDVRNGDTNNGLDTYKYDYETNFAEMQKDKKDSQSSNIARAGESGLNSATRNTRISTGEGTEGAARGTGSESNYSDDRRTSLQVDSNESFSNTKYSLTDNQGRELSKEQQEYFKDSKVRDDEGRLLEVYHGTSADFNIFDKEKIGNNTYNEGLFGKGFYFTNLERLADEYSKYRLGNQHVKKGYLNLTNPFDWNSIKSEEQLNQFIEENNLYSEKVPILKWNPYLQEIHILDYDWKSQALTNRLRDAGYDGIIYTYKQQDENHKPVKEIVAFESNQFKNVDNLNPTNNPDIRYSLTVQEANTGTDNNGKELTKGQQDFFKDSKVTDENGNLIIIYHTTTDEVAQFNEFNPVGTPYYRFGDQVVNYYTDSKEMSGSYANQRYEMADTKKLESIKDAEEYLKTISEQTGNEYNISKHNTMWGVTQDKQISKEARNFIEGLTESEKQQMLNNIYEDEMMAQEDSNYARVFSWNYFDKPLQAKYKSLTDKYLGTADTVAIQQEVMKYLESPVLLNEDNRLKGEVVGIYETEDELLRNIKTDLQKQDWSKNSKLQYEGYLNITNPYIVDAEGRNWNQVVQQSNEFIDDLDERVPQEVKNNLINLFKDSQEKSNEVHENFSTVDGVINYGLQQWVDNNIDKDIKNTAHALKFTNSAYGGADVFETYIENIITAPSSFYHELADSLAINDVITSEEKKQIFDDFEIPERVSKLIKESLDKPFKTSELGDNRIFDFVGEETTLRELYNLDANVYNEVDKYRYEDSYFIEQLQEGNVDIGYELNDILETRAEIMGADVVAKEIAEAAKNGFSKPQLIRTWGTSKTTNDIVNEVIASNKEGTTNYDGVIIQNVVDYGGKAEGTPEKNNVYVSFASNQFKAADNLNPTSDADIRYSLTEKVDSELDDLTDAQYEYFKNTKAVDQDGELEVVHHGTPAEFNVFDIEKAGQTGLMFGNGFYFTTSQGRAEAFVGDNENGLKTGYINIEKPASRDTKTMTFDEFRRLYDALNNNPKMYMEDMGMSGIDALLSDYGDIYNDKENTIRTFYDSYDTDVNLIDNLSYMYNPTEMYKTLRDVTGYDGIIVDNPSEFSTGEKYYIAFNPDQFKLKSNENPTDNVDMRLSFSRANDIAPINGWNVRGTDVAYNPNRAIQDAIAPLQEQIQEITNILKNSTTQGTAEEIAPITEAEAENLPIDENIEVPIRNNLTLEESDELDALEAMENAFGIENEDLERMKELQAMEANEDNLELTPVRDLNDIRDMDEVAKDKKAKAYQYEHPEVKPFFQEEAQILLNEINDVISGQRWMVEGTDYLHPTEWYGIKRQASDSVAALLDGDTLGVKYSKEQLKEGLNAIIEDHGLENKAVSKRLEFMLDDRLRNGYKTIEGYEIQPNQDYLNMLREQAWDKYYEESPWIEEPRIYKDETAPTEITPKETRDIMEMADNEGIRKSMTANQNPVIRKQKSAGKNLVDTLYGGLVNRNVEIDNLSKDSGNRNIKFAGDAANNVMGEINYDVNTAQTNNYGEAIGKGIKGMFAPAKKQGLGDAFNDYLINYSNIDRYAQGKGSQTPLDVSERLVKDYEAQYPQFKEWAQDVWNYGKNARQNLVEAGLIDQDLADYLGKIYPHYVPYVSDYENASQYFEGVGELKPKAFKSARGGAGALLSVEDALARYTYAQKKAVRTNELYKEIVHTLGTVPNFGIDERTDYTDMKDSLYSDSRGNYLTAYENGQQITTQISADLYKELSRTSENLIKDIEEKLSLITKPLQKASEIRRNLITTWNPTFPITNALKDIQDALVNSKHTLDMIKYYPKAIKELSTGKGGKVQQYLALSGSNLSMGEYANNTLSEMTSKIPLVNKIQQINDIIEQAPRYAEFMASLENGDSLQEALYNSREVTTNFGRGGVITKAMNRNGFTFLNASVQGFDKFIRNFSGENGAKGVVAAMAKVAALGIAPALFNHLAFGDDDEEYAALPDYIKDNYYLIKTSEDGDFIRIPKGRMLSIFGSAARRTLEATQGEENAFEGYLSNAWSQVGFNNPEENNIFSPLIQAFGSENGNAWYVGGDIVPTRLQDKPKGEQYDETTDKFSIWLGDKLNVSPYKINYVLDQYGGGISDVLLPMGTEAASSDADSLGDYLIAPIKDKFTADSTTDNKYVSDFYSKREEITTRANGKNATDEDLLQKKYLDSVSTEMTALYKERREIQADTSLSKSEKYEKAQEIKREINELARQGLEGYKGVNQSGSYAEINGKEFERTEDGWKKVNSKTSDTTNSLGLTAKEKENYMDTKGQIADIKDKYSNSDVKKEKVITTIRNSNLTDEAKIQLYKDNYKDAVVDSYMDMGMSADDYLDYKAQNFVADKDSSGKSISGSKKQKVFNYVNSMNIPYEQKAMLVKQEYPSYNEYNTDIINYLNNNPNIDYEEMQIILENLGFKVDSNGNITW